MNVLGSKWTSLPIHNVDTQTVIERFYRFLYLKPYDTQVGNLMHCNPKLHKTHQLHMFGFITDAQNKG